MMTLTISQDTDADSFVALVEHESLADEFEQWQGQVSSVLADPFHPHEMTWIARDGAQPVAFGFVYLLPSVPARFAAVRIGVIASHRRRGLGSRILGEAIAAVRTRAPDCHEISMSAWLPSEAAPGFAAHHGLAHVRYFWLMERPHGPVPEAAFPDGIELRLFDGGETALRDWTDAYNESFAKHYHYVQNDIDDVRAITARPRFRNDGIALAYRDGRCVGFCGNELLEQRGEVVALGTVPAARRIGLGRALLRWGTRWLEAQNARRVTLLVDGENEDALALYRSEGYGVVRTRQVWSQFS